MIATDRLRRALDRGPILLDAAMGTRLIAQGLDLATEDPASWSVRRSDLVLTIHRRDLAAGSDAVLTNTFGANRTWLARYGLADQASRINRDAARLAREAAGPDRLVFGSIGPTASGPDVLLEQAEALTASGVDALVLETHQLDQAREALSWLASSTGLPIVASLFLWPEDVAVAARRLADAGASVIGANCLGSMGAAVVLARRLRGSTDRPLWIKPSPGRASPAVFSRAVPRLLECGVQLVGACCGSDERHIAALRGRLGVSMLGRVDAKRTQSAS